MPVLKTGVPLRGPWVQIPPPPPKDSEKREKSETGEKCETGEKWKTGLKDSETGETRQLDTVAEGSESGICSLCPKLPRFMREPMHRT